jgi:hypothetical protein
METTESLIVKIQPRFEGDPTPAAFYDISGRVDSDGFEFTSSSDGATASAKISLYTLFPLENKKWTEYAGAQEAIEDSKFYFSIPARTEIQIWEAASWYTESPKLLFGGLVMQVEEERIGGGIIQRLTCSDYTALLDERVVEQYRVPRDTYGWEMIKGGAAYSDGLIGLAQLSSSPDFSALPTPTAYRNFTHVSYDSTQDINKATCAKHDFIKGERFKYQPTGIEYEVVGTSGDAIFYRRSGDSGALSLTSGFRVWNHAIYATAVEDHLYAKNQTFKFSNIAHFNSSFYVVHNVISNLKFSSMHRVATATATATSPFLDVALVNVTSISSINPEDNQNNPDLAYAQSSVAHSFQVGQNAYFTKAQKDLLSPWLGALSESPVGSGLYPAAVLSVPSLYTFAIDNGLTTGDAAVEIAGYENGYPISTQAYTLSIFDAVRNNNPFRDSYDSIGVNYKDYVDKVETARYNPILYGYKDSYPNVASKSTDEFGSRSAIWIDFSRKGSELDSVAFDPTTNSATSPIKHLAKIGNRSVGERLIVRTIDSVPVSYNSSTKVITLSIPTAFGYNIADKDRVSLYNFSAAISGTDANSIVNQELTITESTYPSQIDLTEEENSAVPKDFSIPNGTTCTLRFLPTYDNDSGDLKIYTARPHSLLKNETVDLVNFKANTKISEVDDSNFTITSSQTASNPLGGLYSNVSINVGGIDPDIELYPDNGVHKGDKAIMITSGAALTAPGKRHRIIHAMRKTVSRLTVVTAEIINAYKVEDANTWVAYLDEDASGFFSENQIVRVLGLPAPFSGRFRVAYTTGNAVALNRQGAFGNGYYAAVTGASYSAPYITYQSSGHGFTFGTKVTVLGLTNTWNVSEAEVFSATENAFVVVAQNGTPTTLTDANGYAVYSTVREKSVVTRMLRFKNGTTKKWNLSLTCAHHGLKAGDQIVLNVMAAPDGLYEESGVAKVIYATANEFGILANGAGDIDASGVLVVEFERQLQANQGSPGSIGLIVSRPDDAYQEQEAFFVSGVGHTNFDSTVPVRAGRIKRVEYRPVTGVERIQWGDNGVVTLYFNKNLGAVQEHFSEGKSAYFDLTCTSVYGTTYANVFSGIYTIFDSGDTGTVGEHVDLGMAPGTFFIRFIGMPRPAEVSSANFHTPDAGSVISADYLEYVDGRQNVSDTTAYVLGDGSGKKYKPKTRKTPITGFKYKNGKIQITAPGHALKDKNKIYFSSSDTGLAINNTSKKRVVVDQIDVDRFQYTLAASSFIVTKVSSPAGSQVWTIKLKNAPTQAYFSGLALSFLITGIANKITGLSAASLAAVKALNKTGGWASASYFYSADKKTITLTGGPSHAAAIGVSPGPNAKLSFVDSPAIVAPPEYSYVISDNSTSVARSEWTLAKLINVFTKPSSGVSERNYASDLRIKRVGGAMTEIKYYEWPEAITDATYSVTGGSGDRVHTVTVDAGHNLGTSQPAVEFKGANGTWVNITSPDAALSKGIKVTGVKTFTFEYPAATTQNAGTPCKIRTRKAYVPDFVNLTMPRNPEVYVSGRTAIKFVAGQWSALRGERFYMDASLPTGITGTTKLSSTWTIAMQATELPTAGNFSTIFQHGAITGAPYISVGINSNGNPWVSFIVNAGITRTKYVATNITVVAGEDFVLQIRVAYTTATSATVYISKNTGPEQLLSVPTIYRAVWDGSVAVNGSTAGTLILGVEQLPDGGYRYPITAHIGEIIAYDSDLGAEESLKLRAWMMHKWALVNFIDEELIPNYRDIRNIPNNELADSSQVKNAQFGGRTLKQVLESIAKTTGAKFWVDKNKNLHYKELNTKNLIKNSILQDERAMASSRYWNLSNFSVVTQDSADSTKQPGPWGYGYALGYSGTAAGYAHSDFVTENPDGTNLTANQYYFVSAYMKASDTTKAALRVHFYTSATNTVGSSYDISYVDAAPLTRNNDWQRVWSVVKTPATTAKISVGVVKLSSATAVNAYATNFSCVQLTGAYGFADEGLSYELAPARPYLNSGDTASSFIPMATYPFESPDTIRSGGAVANRLYLYASTVNSDENGNTITNENLGQSVLEYTYDYVQGIWKSHGKIIEASQAEDKASTQYELTGKAQAFWKDNGDTINSYEFDHPYNGSAAILEVGSVVPYIWSEVGVVEPMIVKSHKTSLIGSELYHHVSLEQEPDYQKNALVLINRRQMQVDLANSPESRDRPPVVRNFRIASVDADGKLSTLANEFRMSWQYPFDDPTARGVRESGFEIQVRWRKRTVKEINKKTMGRKPTDTQISVGPSENGSAVRIVVYATATNFGTLAVGDPIVISNAPYDATLSTEVSPNGGYRVSWVAADRKSFAYDVLAPKTTTPDGEVTYVTRVAKNYTAKSVNDKFMVAFTQKQGGAFGEWKNIDNKITGTQFAWNPASDGPVDAATTTEISSIGGQADLDFQFRIRAVATNSSNVSVYSVYTTYPTGEDFITIALTKTLEG